MQKAIVMATKQSRFSIAPMGEFCRDLLEIDSWVVGRTAATQATSLLCSTLQRREEIIRERLQYLAQKRGISADKLWNLILKGEAEPLSIGDIPAELKENEK